MGRQSKSPVSFDVTAEGLRLFDVDLNVTDRCNLRCEFCSVSVTSVADRTPELTVAEIAHLFSEFETLGAQVVRIVGGEPFVRRDISDILALAGQFSFSTRVLTNGSIMTEDHVDLIAQSGIDLIAFSIDGHTADQHNKSRGNRNSFKRVSRIVDYCRIRRVPHRMMTVVTADVVSTMKELVCFAEEREFELINFIALGLSGNAINNLHTFPTYEAWAKAVVDLSLFLRDNEFTVQVAALFPHEDRVPIELYAPLEEAGHLHLLKDVWHIDYERFGPARQDGLSYCAAGHSSVTILPNGDVFGCDLMRHIPEFRAGNVHEQSLTEIFREAPVFHMFRNNPYVEGHASFDGGSRTFSCGQCRAGVHALSTTHVPGAQVDVGQRAADPVCQKLRRDHDPLDANL